MKKIFLFIAIFSLNFVVIAQTSTLKDIDGNVYKTIKIGNQIWMAENLITDRFNNGNDITTTDPISLDISKEDNPMYQWIYPDVDTSKVKIGRLYTWYAVTDFRKLCPKGWHVPTDSDWNTLTSYLGGDSVAGAKLKETGEDKWYGSNETSTNESGFTAIPGGYRYPIGTFSGYRRDASFWTSTESKGNYAFYRSLNYNNKNIYKDVYNKALAFSVRCIMN